MLQKIEKKIQKYKAKKTKLLNIQQQNQKLENDLEKSQKLYEKYKEKLYFLENKKTNIQFDILHNNKKYITN